jgi:hypothetical protein
MGSSTLLERRVAPGLTVDSAESMLYERRCNHQFAVNKPVNIQKLIAPTSNAQIPVPYSNLQLLGGPDVLDRTLVAIEKVTPTAATEEAVVSHERMMAKIGGTKQGSAAVTKTRNTSAVVSGCNAVAAGPTREM